MNLEEFIKKEQELKDIALEMLQLEKQLQELREEHTEIFRFLRAEARSLKITYKDGLFVQS